MIYLVILAIFLIPVASIINIPGTIVWYPQLLALQLMGGIFFASQYWKVNKFLALFLGYLVFSYIFITQAAPRTLLCLMIGYAAIAVTLAVSQIKDRKWIYLALVIMSIISIVYSILQAGGHDPVFVPLSSGETNIVSFMGSSNQLGAYSCASAFWMPFLMPLSLIPITLSKSNSAILGLAAGASVYIYTLYGKKAFAIMLVSMVILGMPWFAHNGKTSGAINERIDIWKLSLKQLTEGHSVVNMPMFTDHQSPYYMPPQARTIKCNPLFGYGLGNFFSISNKTQKECLFNYKHNLPLGHVYEHAHNDLVEALYEFGYIGFGLVIMIILSIIFCFLNATKTIGVVLTFSSLVAQSVASCGIYIFHAPVSLFMFCLTLGLFFAEVTHAHES